jgi:ABC-type sugar transport system substrate-binding protein
MDHQPEIIPFDKKEFLYWCLCYVAIGALFYVVPSLHRAFDHLLAAIGVSLALWLAKAFRGLRFISKQTIVLLTIGTILGLLAGSLVTRLQKTSPTRLLFISPAPYLSQQGFYAEVIDELIHQAKQSGFEVAVWMPDHNFRSEDQRALLREAVRSKASYAAVIFTPFLKDEAKDEETLFSFLTDMSDSNVVLFDTDLSKGLQQRLSQSKIPIPACVKGDEEKAGKLVANAMVNYFSEKHITRPLVVRLDKGGSARGEAFQEELKRLMPAVTLRVWITTEYTRGEAADLARINLRDSQQVDAIFAANDVAALGLRDAITQLGLKNIAVFGYDGIFEVRQLVGGGHEPFIIHTVDVKISDQVGYIVWLVSQSVSRDKPLARQPGLPCEAKEPRLL